jgi:hypothetical protein
MFVMLASTDVQVSVQLTVTVAGSAADLTVGSALAAVAPRRPAPPASTNAEATVKSLFVILKTDPF